MNNTLQAAPYAENTGRPVRIITIAFTENREEVTAENPWPIRSLEEMVDYIESAAAPGEQDMILLPEFWPGASTIQTLDGEIITCMCELAKRYGTYIICPLSTKTDEVEKYNTAVLIDRNGEVVGQYHKNYPYWLEFDIPPAPTPGSETPVFDTDFGRIAIATCFDANFPHVWSRYREACCDIVFWPSAYTAGDQLKAHALNNNYYIVTATTVGDSLVFDKNGDRLLYEQGDLTICKFTLDLDRCIFHYDFNYSKVPDFLAEHGQDVELQEEKPQELWYTLRAKTPGVSARKLAAEAGMRELQVYKNESITQIDHYRETGSFQ